MTFFKIRAVVDTREPKAVLMATNIRSAILLPSSLWETYGQQLPNIYIEILLFSVFESELNDVIPVVYTSVAGCRIIGTYVKYNAR
jgi:hypothetical protein